MAQKDSTGEIARMEGALGKLECELQRRYSDMGKSLLEMAGQEQKEINRLVDDIIAARKILTQARCETRCAECMTFNTQGSRYCRHCGTRLPAGHDERTNHNAPDTTPGPAGPKKKRSNP